MSIKLINKFINRIDAEFNSKNRRHANGTHILIFGLILILVCSIPGIFTHSADEAKKKKDTKRKKTKTFANISHALIRIQFVSLRAALFPFDILYVSGHFKANQFFSTLSTLISFECISCTMCMCPDPTEFSFSYLLQYLL